DQTPVANANGPYTVPEGGSITLNSTGSNDPDGSIALYEWDYNYNGVTFNVSATGPSPTFSAAGLDGPSIRTIGLRVTDNYGNVSAVNTALLTITNVAPTVNPLNLAPGAAVNENTAVTVTASATDPSAADTAA